MAEGRGVTIYTIGHANIAVEELAKLLAAQGVRILVDVRSTPYSKFAVQFNKEALQTHMAMRKFLYQYAGAALGGRPEHESYYDEDGHVLYGVIAASPAFQDGLRKLLELARQAPTAIMCSEEDPTACHRRLLLGRVLREEGVRILHIRANGRVQTEEELQGEEAQLSLFDEAAGTSWRSVSPRNLPNKAVG